MTIGQEELQNRSLLIEYQYFPCVNWIKALLMASDIKILSSEPYKKMSFRNRCIVAGGNGLINLSVPLENGRNQRLPFKEVRIVQNGWQLQHWKTLVSCYNKSPFFEFYAQKLQVIFDKKFKYLIDLDQETVEWVKLNINMNQRIMNVVEIKNEDNVLDVRDVWLPRNFQESGFAVRYPQVFEDRIGFQPNLSMLDLLFNEGPNALNIISKTL